MANPTGANQLSPHGYGEVQQQKTLLKESPISGAPMVRRALNTPQRSQRQAVRGRRQAAQTQQTVPSPAPVQATQPATAAQIWATIASIPGASPLIQDYAQKAQNLGQP